MVDRPESEEAQEAARRPGEPLFTLVTGEGDGAMLGLAAGDTAGGAWEQGYSAVTEQAVVIAYELIQHRHIEPDSLQEAIRELDGSKDEEPVYRAESPTFRAWLDRAGRGDMEPVAAPGLDGLSRAAVVGVAFRRDPSALIRETIALTQVFQRDQVAVAAALVAAAAAAAACFAQVGRDIVAGVKEAVVPVLEQLGGEPPSASRLASVGRELDRIAARVGVTDGEEAVAVAGGEVTDPLRAAQVGLLLAAPAGDRPHVAIEQAARVGGSALAAFVGTVVGARAGIRAWPWPFANDTWFAEIGRRLVRGPFDLDGLPIPYAVEQHLMYGARPGFH